MKKGIIISIIVVLTIVIVGVVVLIVTLLKNIPDTGSFTTIRAYSEGYALDITSKNPGHPDSSNNSIYSTYFKVINKNDKTESNYYVHFNKVTSKDNLKSDLDLNKKIKINDKEYVYEIDEPSMWNADLYYFIPDSNDMLIIRIAGAEVFDNHGNQAKTLAMTNLELLESKELAEELNYTISK